MTSAMIEAVAAHRAAWQAFQDAPDGPMGTQEYRLACQANDLETEALRAILSTPCQSAKDLAALRDHLNWYCEEEGEQAWDFAIATLANLGMAFAAGAAIAVATVNEGLR